MLRRPDAPRPAAAVTATSLIWTGVGSVLEATGRCPTTAVEKVDLPRRGALEADTNVRRILVEDAAMVPLQKVTAV